MRTRVTPRLDVGKTWLCRVKTGLWLTVLLFSVGHGGLLAQTEGVDTLPSWQPPPGASDQVREIVAAKWYVAPTDLRLEWGRPRNGETLPAGGGIELLGGGRNGHWIVSFSFPGSQPEKTTVALRAGVILNHPVARIPLARDDVLETQHIEYQPTVQWGPPASDPTPVEPGWVAQRPIGIGDPLSAPAVRPPLLVVSGRPVQIIWSSGALKISLQGKAVGSAALGEQVFVRTDEGHRMAGIVTGPATVLLSSPITGGLK